MAQVSLRKVVKRFDDTEAVRGIDLDIADKEFVVLVGPSGCGKSTTLRMIAGLEEITAGEIAVDGEVVNDVPPKDRDMAMVFQNYALYPHMTVYENMSFGLRLKRYPKDEIARRVQEAARILDITELLERKRDSSPAASASASPWGARSCAIRRSSCSTSRCRISTPSCACRCEPRSSACIRKCAPPPSTSPTTRSRR
jgi:ABC-type sugar transport system ATPase subunit